MNFENKQISICIPAYKRPENIRRLLESISEQMFSNYEVVITDDSPDESVKNILGEFKHLPIRYFKNEKALGTPANWNFGISKAKGEWIKIMHDDDWFSNPNALFLFAEATKCGKKFIVSRYCNVFSFEKKQPAFPKSWQKKIVHQPMVLLARNVLGPPSVTLIHTSVKEQYDELMKWRVDIDFYIRILKQEQNFFLIDKPLINVGISESQVTNACIDQPEVELPEGLLLLNKYGVSPLKNVWVYDAWWRILRNVNIRSKEQLQQYTPNEQWSELILNMVDHQSKIPKLLLRNGLLSKPAMLLSFLLNSKYFRN